MHQFYAEATFIMSKINSDVIYRVRENMRDVIKRTFNTSLGHVEIFV